MKSDEDPQDMDYFLELLEWTQDGFDFKIHFKDPLLASSGSMNDEVMIEITKPELFISAESGQSIKNDKLSMGKEIKTQVPEDVDVDEMEGSNKS